MKNAGHERFVQAIEEKIEGHLKKHEHSRIRDDIDELKRIDAKEHRSFKSDVEKINQDLEKRGHLPHIEIREDGKYVIGAQKYKSEDTASTSSSTKRSLRSDDSQRPAHTTASINEVSHDSQVSSNGRNHNEQSQLHSSEGRTSPENRKNINVQQDAPSRTTVSADVHTGNYSPGAMNRSQFDKELSDPRILAAFAARMQSEVGTQGPAAQLAFAEEVMNRAAARGQTLMQALSGSYYPTPNPGSSNDPRLMSIINKAWKEGTDTTFGATGNASGTVGFGGGPQTVAFNGERFGWEKVDVDAGWAAKYRQLKNGGSSVA